MENLLSFHNGASLRLIKLSPADLLYMYIVCMVSGWPSFMWLVTANKSKTCLIKIFEKPCPKICEVTRYYWNDSNFHYSICRRRGEENASSLTLVPDYMDRGSPADDDIQQPTATRHLLLVRHGQTTIEKDDTKRILTQLGKHLIENCIFVQDNS